jgi:CubicO group peptidase (beta-lactamase class C family)
MATARRGAPVVLALVMAVCAGTSVEPARQAPVAPLLADKNAGAISADLRAFIPSLMAEARIPGLQVALVRDGRVAWRGSFGVRNTATGAPVTDDTIFEAASLTKPFFAYYVMKLAGQKVLSLDRPLVAYLPPEKIAAILGHPLDEPGFRRDWFEKVTARHVLSHSAGFPHGESGRPFPLAFEPGTKWKYSADGYFYLQRVVEHLKGGTLDALMQKEVLDPLGMTRSAMIWRPAFENGMASGHGLLGRPEATRRRTEAHAGASLYTTAGDYARFLCAVLNGEGLAPETLKEMIAPRIDMGASKVLGWSLGFGTQSDANGLALWQWGDYGVFRNYAIAYPGRGTGVVYLANSFYGLGVTSALVARSVGGQALGAAALNYRPYDSPLYRFVWDVQEKGPAAVNELDRLRREHPGLFERDWIGFFASSFLEAGMMPQALALFESDLRDHPRSGRAAVAVAEACVKTGDRAKAKSHFELALEAAEEKVDAAITNRRLEYLAALDRPAPADLAGTWSGVMWVNDGQIDLVTMVIEKRGPGYEATLSDTLGLIPDGTKTGPFAWTGGELAFSFTIPLQGGMDIRTRLTRQGATLKGRWEDVKGGNSGPVELALAPRRP